MPQLGCAAGPRDAASYAGRHSAGRVAPSAGQLVSRDAVHVPYCYWAIGFTDKQAYLAAEKAGTLDDLPTNHSPAFLPPLQPTLRTGTEALVAAALAWLAPH